MKCKFSDTKFRWALWLGVVLFLGAMLTNAFFSWLDISTVQQVNGAVILENCGYFIGFLLIVLVVPIVEEVVYRLWGRETNASYILTIILVPLITLLFTSNWMASACILLALLLAYLLTKGDLRLTLFMIITALGFGFGHILSFIELNIAAVMNMIEIVGLAFIFSFLAVNYGLLWAIIAHCLYNLVAFFVLLLPITFQTEHYNVEVRPLMGNNYVGEEFLGDTLIVRGTSEMAISILTSEQEMAEGVQWMERTTFYRCVDGMNMNKLGEMHQLKKRTKMLPKYELTIMKKCGDFRPNYNEVILGMEDLGLMNLDTIYAPLYKLEIENSLFVNPSKEQQKGSIEDLMLAMQIEYDVKMILDRSINPQTPVSIDLRMMKDMSLDEFQKVLKSNGFVLKLSKDKKARIINYYGI